MIFLNDGKIETEYSNKNLDIKIDSKYTFINEGFMNTTGDSKLDKEALKRTFFIEFNIWMVTL